MDWNRRRSETLFPYRRCTACQTTFLEVVPTDLERYYEGEYHLLPSSERELSELAERERFKLDIVRDHAVGGRLLEIGPSFGAFAYLASRAGFEVEAVEPDRGCRTVLETLVGVRVVDRLDVAEREGRAPYDVIVLWQVFEHLPDAGATLARVRDLLRPGGIVVIATPNPESPQARLLGARWAHVDAPRHLAIIPAPSLRRVAAELGLETVLWTTRDRGSLGWNSFGWSTSLANLTTWRPLATALGLLGRMIALALRPLEQTGGRGASYTVVFRRWA